MEEKLFAPKNSRYSVTPLQILNPPTSPRENHHCEEIIPFSPRAYKGVTALQVDLLLGPPGCGKTWRVKEAFEQELALGLAPEKIALVTFTRAARAEVKQRILHKFAYGENRLAWVRTIHSAAFHLLYEDGKRGAEHIMNDKRWAEFAERYGYELSQPDVDLEDGDSILSPARQFARHDRLRYVNEWGRNCLLDPETTLRRTPVEGVSVSEFRLFARRLEEFKREHELRDFPDLLTDVIDQGLRPPVKVAIVDEAHDLSPLQLCVVEAWFSSCDRVLIAADDDQAIYNFQGANAAWIQALTKRVKPEILTRSHRVPVLPHALAQRIIGANRQRIEKLYEPAKSIGEIIRCDLDQALALIDGKQKTFILCRNRTFFRRVAGALMERALPFIVEGWGAYSPFSDRGVIEAARISLQLAAGENGPFATKFTESWLSFIPVQDGVLPRGVKAQVAKLKGEGSFMREALIEELGLGGLLNAIKQKGALSELRKLKEMTRRYLLAVVRRHEGIPEPIVTLTTIHAAKGREAELVIVLPDMTKLTHGEYMSGSRGGNEGENRVFYVAVTRTKETLVLVEPSGRRYFAFPKLEFRERVL